MQLEKEDLNLLEKVHAFDQGQWEHYIQAIFSATEVPSLEPWANPDDVTGVVSKLQRLSIMLHSFCGNQKSSLSALHMNTAIVRHLEKVEVNQKNAQAIFALLYYCQNTKGPKNEIIPTIERIKESRRFAGLQYGSDDLHDVLCILYGRLTPPDL